MVTSNHISVIEVYNLISDIPDPEIPVITIKDLGMLRKVDYTDENYVVTITPTYTACPAMKLIEDQIKERLHEHHIDNVKVNLTYTPAWTTDWLSEEAKQKMREYGIAPPTHSSCSKIFAVEEHIQCPQCKSKNSSVISKFGSTACKALYKCNDCKEVFDYFKCH